ncbi:hypothetical protein KC727_02290 [Candidatus Kaiserbacteria bacterium]|nr:hypothetical protein [Candidatus Kaiserbacteria bacterium]
MSDVLEANIFFFITSLAVVAFTVLLCMVLYHVLKIVKSIRVIIERIEAGSEVIAEDAAHLRTYFTETSFVAHVIRAFFGRKDTSGKKSSRRARKNTDS